MNGCMAQKKQKGHKRQQPSATEMFVIAFFFGGGGEGLHVYVRSLREV